MKDITFTLTPEEANAIVQLVGQLPTSSNAYPLFMKLGEQLKMQAESQAELSAE